MNLTPIARRRVVMQVTCIRCERRYEISSDIPEDVVESNTIPYRCKECCPEVHTLSKREDYLETRRPLWDAAGGYDNFKRKQNTLKCGKWRAKKPEHWRSYMNNLMKKRRQRVKDC
jgi:hypothetical protein